MSLAPLYLDRHDIVTQAATSIEKRTGPLIAGYGVGIGSTTLDLSKAKEQTKHYTYWNYVAIKRISDCFSAAFPNVGYQVKRKEASEQLLRGKRRQFVAQQYGNRWVQSYDVLADLEPVPESHPLLRLLQSVNGQDTWTDFAFEVALFWCLTGRFYIWLINDGFGLPVEMWVIPTHWVDHKYDRHGVLSHYEILPEGDRSRKMDLKPDEVLMGKWKSPRSKIVGWGSLEAGPLWTDNSEAIERSRGNSFKQGINPSVLLQLEADHYKGVSVDDLERIKEKFINRAAGVHRIGEPLITPPGVKATPWSHNPREMDYASSSDQARDNQLALHGVPNVVAGVTKDYNRATADAAKAVFCEMTMNPMFRSFAGTLTERLASRFDPRLRIWYDDCTPNNAEQELEETKFDWEMGAFTPDERRHERGREAFGLPESQTGYLPVGRTPIDPALIPEVPEPLDDGDDDDEAKDGDDDEKAKGEKKASKPDKKKPKDEDDEE